MRIHCSVENENGCFIKLIVLKILMYLIELTNKWFRKKKKKKKLRKDVRSSEMDWNRVRYNYVLSLIINTNMYVVVITITSAKLIWNKMHILITLSVFNKVKSIKIRINVFRSRHVLISDRLPISPPIPALLFKLK